MCDQDHFDQDEQEYVARGLVTRREFGALVGAGLTVLVPRLVNAVAVTESDVSIKTPDGTADCYFVHPATGAAAAVLVWPDIFGLRPAFRQMGKRLAESGYSVLVVIRSTASRRRRPRRTARRHRSSSRCRWRRA